MGTVGSLVFLALLVEGAIEFFVADPLKKAGKPTWFVRYVALAAGIAAAFGFRADLTAVVGLEAPEWVAFVATGLAIGRGANYLSDLVGRFGGTDSRIETDR